MSTLNDLFKLGETKIDDVMESDSTGFRPLPSDIYPCKIKYAYMDKSSTAHTPFVQIVLDINGRTVSPKPLYIVYKDTGTPCKIENGKKMFTPAWKTLNSLAYAVTGKTLDALPVEDKLIEKYDFKEKKNVPVKVPCFVDLCGKDIKVALKEYKEYKQQKVGDTYVPTTETRVINIVDKYLSAEGKTAIEISQGKEAEFATKWLESNKGKVFTEQLKPGVTPVAPSSDSGLPNLNSTEPSAPASAVASLFGD